MVFIPPSWTESAHFRLISCWKYALPSGSFHIGRGYYYHLSLYSCIIALRFFLAMVQKKQEMLVIHTRFDDLSQFDFEQGETIELSGNIDTEQYSNLQYFSTREEFEDRISTLIDRARKTDLNTIYGTIKIKESFIDGEHSSIDSIDDAIARFEDVLIRNIRVHRKYTPPVGSERKKRKSDKLDNNNFGENFDLACRAPTTPDNPDMLNFILYDCGYGDALKKIKKFEDVAQDLGLRARVEIFQYTKQPIWARNTKPKFLPLRPRDGKTEIVKRLHLFFVRLGLF